ncbi:class I SAM-dependent methyltransferase [Metabacillus idriensis]|uniref:class I SAM-dependent methyltransferase n=1 Tax=Metabacillus idriensis TaxID=324768 RepID=UPI00174DD431|nr:class I SAM-dependent methyltransferase [Metabacillus idriensis]
MKENIRLNNVDRFTGFASLYDRNRPRPPLEVIKIITKYLGDTPKKLIDVGCGTGLSSFIWMNEAAQIIGVEPNDDMLAAAVANWEKIKKPSNLQFIKGFSNQLGSASESVDVVTCSQSFHWMEPESTLKEFARVLRTGGVFAAYDCDWPPAFDWTIEDQYKKIISHADKLIQQLAPMEEHSYKWDKNKHLQNIEESGLFRFSREIVFHHWESCDADRYTNIALSQGGLQTALKKGADELLTQAEIFRKNVTEAFAGTSQDILFSYRMRLGVK